MSDASPISELEMLLARYERSTPELLEKRALLKRVDSKFVLSEDEATVLVAKLVGRYAVLPAGGPRSIDDTLIATYRTRYFDTEDLRCFHDHRRGRRPRQKVRLRHYQDRSVCFIEIKSKRSEFISSKKRRPKPFDVSDLGDDDLTFINEFSRLPAEQLVGAVWTDFRRATLIGLETNERITIDLDLDIGGADSSGERERIGGVVIVEVKQSPFSSHTPIMLALREGHHRPTSASKYCTATALSRTGLRLGRLLPALRTIERMRK